MPDELSAEVVLYAKAAGLDLALTQFPQDVAKAAKAARAATSAIKLPDDIVAEPWPPMQVGYPA